MHVNIRIILTRSGQGKFEPETDHQGDKNVPEVFEHGSGGQILGNKYSRHNFSI